MATGPEVEKVYQKALSDLAEFEAKAKELRQFLAVFRRIQETVSHTVSLPEARSVVERLPEPRVADVPVAGNSKAEFKRALLKLVTTVLSESSPRSSGALLELVTQHGLNVQGKDRLKNLTNYLFRDASFKYVRGEGWYLNDVSKGIEPAAAHSSANQT